jgi:hypothetical protein
MIRTIALLAAISLSAGCSTIMNDRMTDVSVTSEPAGAHFTITNQDGAPVASGVTPAQVKLDAAAGFFDGEKYQVAYDNGPTVELNSRVTGWYWVGFCVSVVSGLIVDPITGDMFSLPAQVNGDMTPRVAAK